MPDGARVRTRLGRSERREQIIAAAAEVFRGRPVADVTFEEIADAAGVSRALVYNYFGDRNGLVEAVYLRHVHALRTRVTTALTTEGGLRPATTQVVRAHLEFARDDPVAYRYAAGETAFGQLPRLDAQRVAEVAEVYGGGPDAELLAKGFVMSVRAMVLHWLEAGAPDIDRAEAVIVHFLWSGLSSIDELGLQMQPSWTAPLRADDASG